MNVVIGLCGLLAAVGAGSVRAQDVEVLCEAAWFFAGADWDAEGRIEGGLRIRLAPGWHTYAPDPGEVGAPPIIKITVPEGIEVSKPRFPPHREFADPAGISYGFENELLIRYNFLNKHGVEPDEPLVVEVELLLCRDICVPFIKKIEFPWPKADDRDGHSSAKWRERLLQGGWGESLGKNPTQEPKTNKEKEP